MLLFFDTETTGKANMKLPPDHVSQPHLVQLAAILCEDDGTERAVLSCIIDPDERFTIPDEAARVHGITTEIASIRGLQAKIVSDTFLNLCLLADKTIAHNADFDILVMRKFLGKVSAWWPLEVFDTMKASTEICKIPSKYPQYSAYKWPTLSECYQFFFNEKLEGAHDALIDVRACKRVYFKLKELENSQTGG